jgi:hypothetical protein
MKRYALLLAATLVIAQAAAPEVEITAEPHHHLSFENTSVRVFNVEVPPNTETLMHWHRHDYISIALGRAEIANTVKDKPAVDLRVEDGETRFAAATFAHFVHTVSDTPFRNVTIEILQDQALRQAASPWDPKQNEDRALITFDGGSQQILFVKDAIRVSEFELQPGAHAAISAHRGPCLLVAVSDLNLRSDSARQASTAVDLRAGGFKWFDRGSYRRLTNTASKPTKFVTLEFP